MTDRLTLSLGLTLLACVFIEACSGQGSSSVSTPNNALHLGVIAVPSVEPSLTPCPAPSPQNTERLRCGEAWANNNLVFPGLAGTPWDPDNFSNDFRKLARRGGLGSLGPHVLRHTAATEMLRQGIHPKVVAERLGHASTRMTLDVYSHVIPAMESEAAAKVDLALREAFGQQSGQQSATSLPTVEQKTAAKGRALKVISGGRSRTRTSDLILIRDAL